MARKSRWTALAVMALCASAATAPAAPYDSGQAIYGALAQLPLTRLMVGGGELDIAFANEEPGEDHAEILTWIRRSAEAVSTYFGRFPVRRVGLLVVLDDGERINTGTTFGYDGSAIRIHVGRNAKPSAFQQDWIMVHEMTHLALPNLPRASLWLQEGNATYVEPIARAEAGQLDDASVWRWTLEDLASGLPKPGDGGLDGTQDHDRIYWGGAGFWLLADVRIRERTHNRLGVQAALRAINKDSGGNGARWTPEHMMAVGDAATGGTELADLYAQMKDGPFSFDTHALFARLGLSLDGRTVLFDDGAPLAQIRRAITARSSR